MGATYPGELREFISHLMEPHFRPGMLNTLGLVTTQGGKPRMRLAAPSSLIDCQMRY
jgi:hypothetical protein